MAMLAEQAGGKASTGEQVPSVAALDAADLLDAADQIGNEEDLTGGVE